MLRFLEETARPAHPRTPAGGALEHLNSTQLLFSARTSVSSECAVTWISGLSVSNASLRSETHPQIPGSEKCPPNPQNMEKRGLGFHKRCKKGHVETDELYPAPLMYTDLKKKCWLLLQQGLDTWSTTQGLAGQTNAQAVFWAFR